MQVFNVHGSVHRNNILIHIQQDAMLHSLFYLETALHVLGGTTTHHQEHKQLYLQHLVFVTPLLLSATRVINKRILVELLGIREESVILYLCGMNPLAYLAYFSISKLVYYIINARVIQSNTFLLLLKYIHTIKATCFSYKEPSSGL
jgi:hypothetical protein